jgi:cysteine desulfuration protein SufE
MSINEIQEEIIAEFADYDDWMDKYSYLIELGNDMPAFPDEHRREENIIEGCQSTVWIHAEKDTDGKVIYQGDADAIIVKGIVGLLIRVLSGHTPEEILDTELYFIDKVGFKENLSPTRSNGLLAMVKQMKIYAAQYKE